MLSFKLELQEIYSRTQVRRVKGRHALPLPFNDTVEKDSYFLTEHVQDSHGRSSSPGNHEINIGAWIEWIWVVGTEPEIWSRPGRSDTLFPDTRHEPLWWPNI
jgi:hypothetical protein